MDKLNIKIYGKEHKKTIITQVYIAAALGGMNILKEATRRVHEVFALASRMLGPDHVLTVRTEEIKEEIQIRIILENCAVSAKK